MKSFRIDGIKQSGELATVSFRYDSGLNASVSQFLRTLAKRRINVLFLSTSHRLKKSQVTFCVKANDHALTHECLEDEKDLLSHAEYICPVGLLSIFNHEFSLKLLGSILTVFGKHDIPFYGLATSLSSFSFLIDYGRIDSAILFIQQYSDVPSDQIYSPHVKNRY